MLEKYRVEIKDIDGTRMEFSLQLVAFKNGAIDGASGARRAGPLQLDPSPYVTEELFSGEDNERLTAASLRGAIATKQSSLLIHWIASLRSQ
jgi:hypothetical protein